MMHNHLLQLTFQNPLEEVKERASGASSISLATVVEAQSPFRRVKHLL